DEEFLAQWEQAEADAVDVLRQALPAQTLAPLPAGALQQACQHLRAGLGRHDPAVETIRRAAGLDPPLPADDAELWLAAAAALRRGWPAQARARRPAGARQRACQHRRAGLGRHAPAVETTRRAAGRDPPLPADDAELWLAAAGALIAMREPSGLDAELE